jgi:hypothetical protein
VLLCALFMLFVVRLLVTIKLKNIFVKQYKESGRARLLVHGAAILFDKS